MITEFGRAKVTWEEKREPVLVCHDGNVHLLFRKDELGSSIFPPCISVDGQTTRGASERSL